MALEQAKAKLARFFPTPPENAQEAKTLLYRYWNGFEKLPPDHERSILNALSILSTSDMTDHAMDVKRRQRAQGKHMRKNRTGSRRG